jgi:hypothetical protein
MSLPVRALRCAGVWLLLALLAVPLAASGHHHEPLRPTADSCTQCAAVGSLSAASLQAAPQLTVVVCGYAHHPAAPTASGSRLVLAQSARAPPPADCSSPA